MTTSSRSQSSSLVSKKSAIILASIVSASVVLIGVTFAQGLTIPTNLNNAMITIQKIFLSANGVSTDASAVPATISLDGTNGNITTAGPEIRFTHPNYACTSTACVLTIDANGLIALDANFSGFDSGSGNESELWQKTANANPATSSGDIYFGKASNFPDPEDIKVRIGVNEDSAISEGNQLIVRDGIETRSNFDITTPINSSLETEAIIPSTQNIIASTIENDTGTNALIIASQIQTGISAATKSSTILLQSQDPDNVNTNVGINLTAGDTPAATLDVNGDAAIGDVAAPSGDKLTVYGSTRANNYLYNSDRRYKSDIKPLTSSLESLLKISGYHYFNKLEDKDSIGVIAQEVELVYPELVQTNKDGYKSVAYGNLVAPIIEAIRELSTKIESLFALYISQQSRIDMLEARLQSLENTQK